MDTSSPHGHPNPRRPSDVPTQQPPSQRVQPLTTPAHATFTLSPQHETRVTPNQRRLQLRSLAFGSQLSAQRLGAQFSRIFHGNDEPQSAPQRNGQQENRVPQAGSLRSTKSNHSLRSSLGILNEISNSTHVTSLRKRASVPIYEDYPERPLLEQSPATPDSRYHDASSTIRSPLSPSDLSYIHDEPGAMRLREVSGNEQRRSPSFSSPLSATNKVRRRTVDTRQSSFEAAEYIEHIEKQLEQVKQAMHSPRSGKPIHEKIKTLRTENTRLKKVVETLESSFETRVKTSVEHMTASEGELRRKVRFLEEDLRERDIKIEELEYEYDQSRLDQGTLETLKATIERLEADKQTLQDANQTIEKRNDMLTELLAFSPTKTHQGFELASPLRNRGRLPRPVSMMGSLTRFPLSPTSKQISRPASMVNSPAALSFGGYFDPRNVLEFELEHPCNDANDADSGLGESCSAKSPIMSSSRRSTLVSQSSTSPSAWGLPLSTSPDEAGGTIRPTQKRKPRRFMTGSTQLKPLLLPTMAADSAGLTSPRGADKQDSFEALIDERTLFSHDLEGTLISSRREVSAQSLDPTTSFLSTSFQGGNLQEDEAGSSEPGSSPPPIPGLEDLLFSSIDSTSLAVELEDTEYLSDGLTADIEEETGVEENLPATTRSPERRTLFSPSQAQRDHLVLSQDMPADGLRSSPATQEPLVSSIDALIHSSPSKIKPDDSSPNPRKRRRTRLMTPNDEVMLSQPSEHLLLDLTATVTVSPLVLWPPRLHNDQIFEQPGDVTPAFQPHVNPITLAAKAAHRTPPSNLTGSKRLSCPTTPLEILQRQSASSSPLAAVTIRSIYGTLSRYTTYIRDFKRDPLALARRVIANAWRSNWKRFGKLSWWVLGIFLPGGRRDFTESTGWDWGHYDAEAIAETHCALESLDLGRMVSYSPASLSSPEKRSVRFDDQHDSYRTQSSESPTKPVLKGGQEQSTGLGRSLFLWGKFSVAIMLAVGGAVLKGPAEMLRDCDTRMQASGSGRAASPHIRNGRSEPTLADEASNDSSELPQNHPGHVLSKQGANVFTQGVNFDFSKTARSPSRIFTFVATKQDNFWNEEEDDPDEELDHYHQPDYGEELEN